MAAWSLQRAKQKEGDDFVLTALKMCLERHISGTNAPFTTRNPSDGHHMNSLTLDLVTVAPMMQWYPANTIRPVMPMSLTNRYVSKRGRMQGWVIPSCRFDLVSVLFPSLHLE